MGGNLNAAVAKTRVCVRRTLQDFAKNSTQLSSKRIVIALSGGADSLALSAACAFEGRKLGLEVLGAVVDHGLQPESAKIAAVAAATAEKLGASTSVLQVTVKNSGEGPEAAARKARYRALFEYCEQQQAGLLMTGHTLNDQAEQVLLGLLRGSGMKTLSGIAKLREQQNFSGYRLQLARPFLEVTRAETEAACAAQNIEFWIDPHNSDPAYLRVQVRQLLFQIQATLGADLAPNLARSAELLSTDAAALEELAENEFRRLAEVKDGQVCLSVAGLKTTPEAIRNRIIRKAGAQLGAYYTQKHTIQVAELVTAWRGQKALNLPQTLVRRERGMIIFVKTGYDKFTRV